MKKITKIFLGMIFILVLLTGCAKTIDNTNSQAPAAKAQVPQPPAPVKQELSGTLMIAGSQKVADFIIPAAKQFMEKNPKTIINVTVTGSSEGVKAITEGKIDIGMISRDIKKAEVDEATKVGKNFFKTNIYYYPVVIAVNKNNPITDISADQLNRIFFKDQQDPITEWSTLTNGAKTGKIKPYATIPGMSGSADLFLATINSKGKFADNVFQDDEKNGSVNDKRMIDPNSIGFSAESLVRTEGEKIISFNGVKPTKENIVKGDYTMVLAGTLITNGQPTGLAKEFISYALKDPNIAKLVENAGYVSVG